MSKRCIERDCKKVAIYCVEHYNEETARAYGYRKKLRSRNHLLLLLFFGSLLLLTIPYFMADVDEDAFCKQKVEAYFPEYNFEVIRSSDSNTCIGEYTPGNTVQRDGLKVVDDSGEGRKRIYFELIEEKDKEYVSSDDGWAFIAVIMLVAGSVGLVGTMQNW